MRFLLAAASAAVLAVAAASAQGLPGIGGGSPTPSAPAAVPQGPIESMSTDQLAAILSSKNIKFETAKFDDGTPFLIVTGEVGKYGAMMDYCGDQPGSCVGLVFFVPVDRKLDPAVVQKFNLEKGFAVAAGTDGGTILTQKMTLIGGVSSNWAAASTEIFGSVHMKDFAQLLTSSGSGFSTGPEAGVFSDKFSGLNAQSFGGSAEALTGGAQQ